MPCISIDRRVNSDVDADGVRVNREAVKVFRADTFSLPTIGDVGVVCGKHHQATMGIENGAYMDVSTITALLGSQPPGSPTRS